MSDPRPVLARRVRSETLVERSRFLCTLVPVADPAALDAAVAAVRREFPDARHHVTASVLGEDGATQRCHDDGEPAGTGGAPVLAALVGAGVTDVVAVVTRYFGGVLLGTGGLVRAYGGAVSQALAGASLVHRRHVDLVEVTAPVAAAGRLEADLRRRHALEEVEWTGEGWHAVVPLPVGALDDLAAELAAAGLPADLHLRGRAVR